MIITCDACTKRYVIDAQAINAEGRMVRCASCGHSWKVYPVKESVLDLFPENEPQPFMPEKKQKKWRPSKWILIAFLFIALISVIILGREQVITLWPATAHYYKQAGLPIETPGTGLSLTQITVNPLDEGGEKTLSIRGVIFNTTPEVKYLPSLKVRAYGNCSYLTWWEKLLNIFKGARHSNPNLCLLEVWKHTLPETRLFPGEKAHFETAPEKTTHAITDLTVSF